MKCRDCKHGKKMTRRGLGCVDCIRYGMILLEDHECRQKGCEPRSEDGDEDLRGAGGDEAEVRNDGTGIA